MGTREECPFPRIKSPRQHHAGGGLRQVGCDPGLPNYSATPTVKMWGLVLLGSLPGVSSPS